MPYLSRICIYPFKSLDGCSVTSATMLASGALKGDRAFAIVDEEGRFINGKRTPKVHSLRSFFDGEEKTLTLRIQGTDQVYIFQVDVEREALTAWLSTYSGGRVRVVENGTAGFPDDIKAPGPTVISTATLREVASWYPGLDEHAMRLRFRANLEIAGVPPFWEDRLFSEAGSVVQFRIGDVLFEGTNPCKRCVVPSPDPLTGDVLAQFQRTFMVQREEHLPTWSTATRFDHFYRVSCNTRIPASEAGKRVRVGDLVSIVGIASSE